MKLWALAILSGSMLIFACQAMAAVPPTIRLEAPAEKISSPNLVLDFVVMDIEDRDITVECYKQGPNGGGYSIFDTINIAAGNNGDSGICEAALAGDGAYDFYAAASVDGNSAESETVSTELITGTPGTPVDYDRDGDNCNVSFITANDGLTAKIELYRSTELEFTANASTLAASVVALPNTSGNITDPGADCDDYFYAIRAVSEAGAGSGFVGDEKVVVKHKTKTKTITVRPEATGAIVTAGTGVAGGEAGTEGEVAGAETGTGEEGVLTEGEEGQVLGEETERAGSFFGKYWPWGLGLIILAAIYYGFIRRKRKGDSGNSINVE